MDQEFDKNRIEKYLKTTGLNITTVSVIDSTNTALKDAAISGAPDGSVLIADRQTAGRGRLGRSFYSPENTGLYMSILLRPRMRTEDVVCITTCAAVAAARGIESIAPVRAQIKWVNDIFINDRKVCGILAEADLNPGTASVNWAVVGIGINLYTPHDGFPADLTGIAGSVFRGEAPENLQDLRCRLAAAVLDSFMDDYYQLSEKRWHNEYRRRCMVLGRRIHVLSPGKEPEPAEAADIDSDFGLIVRMEDGHLRTLNSGEVSIRQR